MEIEFSERREYVPKLDDGTGGFWVRVYVGTFEHERLPYVVALDGPDKEIGPDLRARVEALLRQDADALIRLGTASA